jgi:Flp pilus assembly protein TadD
MGRLEEAKREFRGALTQFPNERVAKNALACLLIEAGETSEARPLLAAPDPKTEQDWRDYHVAAMAYIKDGNYEEAEKLLGDGAQAVPFYSAREVFRASLAYVKLLRRQYQAASSLIGSGNVHNFRPPTVAVIDAHASAALGHLDRAQESLFDAERSRSNAVIHLADFIRKRYSLGIYVGQFPDNEEAGLLDGAIAKAEFGLALRIAA